MSKPFVVVVIGALLAPANAPASSWSIGSHLGLSAIHSSVEGAGTSTVLAWPATALTYQPGIRIAFGDSTHRRDLLVDSGLFFIDEAGSSYRVFLASFGYQRCLGSQGPTTPFANVAIGLFHEGGAGQASIAGSLGVGVGVRRTVGAGHGALRAEGRFDWLMRDTTTGRPALKMYGIRLGFDLWE